MLRQPVGARFQVLFHSPPGVLFTFPSRYWCAIGRREYLALEGGPPGFPLGFSCPGVLGVAPTGNPRFAYRALTVSGGPFQVASTARISHRASPQRRVRAPRPPRRNGCGLGHGAGLGCSAFARRYWRNPDWFLLLGVVGCFRSPGSPCEGRESQGARVSAFAPSFSGFRIDPP